MCRTKIIRIRPRNKVVGPRATDRLINFTVKTGEIEYALRTIIEIPLLVSGLTLIQTAFLIVSQRLRMTAFNVNLY